MKKLNWKWRCLGVITAAMVFSSSASAGVIGPFVVSSDGTFEETETDLFVVGLVTFQEPDLGFEVLTAAFGLMDGDPATFEGDVTLDIDGGSSVLFMHATGSLYHLIDLHALAGTFEIVGGTGVFEGSSTRPSIRTCRHTAGT